MRHTEDFRSLDTCIWRGITIYRQLNEKWLIGREPRLGNTVPKRIETLKAAKTWISRQLDIGLIIQDFRIVPGAKVLFLNFHGYLEVGTVVTVEKELITITWLDGYKSRNDELKPENILGIELPGFSGHFRLFVDRDLLCSKAS